MKSGTYPGGNKTMKYIKKIDFSQKNLKPITCMQYKNIKSLENSIDDFSMQIFMFSLRLLFVTKKEKNPPSKISYPPHWEKFPILFKAMLPVVTYEENFIKHS